jgi:DNA-directed RNA polymerase specialized sigma24 family protein
MASLSPEAFRLLLERLDADPAAAAEGYELLRLKLTKMVTWKGCRETDAETLADTTLDRIAAKIGGGEVIENMNAYACQVLRFVWLEYSRKRIEDPAGDELPEVAVEPDTSFLDEPDIRLNCLGKCMNEVVPETADRTLIVGYYDADTGKKNKDQRKDLAAKLGLTMNTLKVKACRLRARLEKCINECVARAVTKTAG